MKRTRLEWLLDLCRFEKHEIGRKGLDRYLTRYVLRGRKDPETGLRRYGDGPKLFLHIFHRGDPEPYFHDHPFPFTSLIVSGGYWEHTEAGKSWYGPGSVLRRPAVWKHRVEVPPGKVCVTIVWIGPKERSWGFWCASGWIPWRQHETNQNAGKSGCGD